MSYARSLFVSASILLAAPHAHPAPDRHGTTVDRQAQSCSTVAHAAFDFWVGEWHVTDAASGRLAGINRIERMDSGCVVRERYQTPGAYSGQSLNWYDPASGQWHQLWLDSDGLVLRLAGGPTPDGMMVLDGVGRDSVGPTVERITWHPRPDGTVRQHWTQARSSSGPWRTVFDGIYVRRMP